MRRGRRLQFGEIQEPAKMSEAEFDALANELSRLGITPEMLEGQLTSMSTGPVAAGGITRQTLNDAIRLMTRAARETGRVSTISGGYSSIAGGTNNTASGVYAAQSPPEGVLPLGPRTEGYTPGEVIGDRAGLARVDFGDGYSGLVNHVNAAAQPDPARDPARMGLDDDAPIRRINGIGPPRDRTFGYLPNNGIQLHPNCDLDEVSPGVTVQQTDTMPVPAGAPVSVEEAVSGNIQQLSRILSRMGNALGLPIPAAPNSIADAIAISESLSQALLSDRHTVAVPARSSQPNLQNISPRSMTANERRQLFGAVYGRTPEPELTEPNRAGDGHGFVRPPQPNRNGDLMPPEAWNEWVREQRALAGDAAAQPDAVTGQMTPVPQMAAQRHEQLTVEQATAANARLIAQLRQQRANRELRHQLRSGESLLEAAEATLLQPPRTQEEQHQQEAVRAATEALLNPTPQYADIFSRQAVPQPEAAELNEALLTALDQNTPAQRRAAQAMNEYTRSVMRAARPASLELPTPAEQAAMLENVSDTELAQALEAPLVQNLREPIVTEQVTQLPLNAPVPPGTPQHQVFDPEYLRRFIRDVYNQPSRAAAVLQTPEPLPSETGEYAITDVENYNPHARLWRPGADLPSEAIPITPLMWVYLGRHKTDAARVLARQGVRNLQVISYNHLRMRLQWCEMIMIDEHERHFFNHTPAGEICLYLDGPNPWSAWLTDRGYNLNGSRTNTPPPQSVGGEMPGA